MADKGFCGRLRGGPPVWNAESSGLAEVAAVVFLGWAEPSEKRLGKPKKFGRAPEWLSWP